MFSADPRSSLADTVRVKLETFRTILVTLLVSGSALVSCKSAEKKDDAPAFQASLTPRLVCTSTDSDHVNMQFVLLADSAEPSKGAISVLNGGASISQGGVWLVSISETNTAVVGAGNSAKGEINLNVAIGSGESNGEGIVVVPGVADRLKVNCRK